LGWSIVSAEPAIPNATQDVSGSINLLLLPTGQFFGDESRDATNYPLVRLINVRTGHVFYCRTHDHSSMAVASDGVSSTHFDVPDTVEPGLSRLEVVANGIASEPQLVLVE
jgi:hypothetical protein